MMKKFTVFVFLIVLLAACGTENVDKAKWQAMSADDQLLYVKSLLGAEQVKESKEGSARRHPHPAEVYAAAIREFYTRGDMRQPAEIFEALAEKPGAPAATTTAPVPDAAPDPHDERNARPPAETATQP